MAQIPYLERVKIQSEILLPLFKLLRQELGEERASALLREAVQTYAGEMGKSVANSVDGTSLDKVRSLLPAFSAQDALSIESLSDNERELSVNVRGCKYAEYFHAIGEPEFGAMMTCEVDPPLTSGIGKDIALTRTQTIMSGASHCDFRWSMEPTDDRD